SWSEFEHGQCLWKIPRHNCGHDANRLAANLNLSTEHAGANICEIVFFNQICVVTQNGTGVPDLQLSSDRDRHAILGANAILKIISASINFIGQFAHVRSALSGSPSRPYRWIIES